MPSILFIATVGILILCIIVMVCYTIILRKKYKCNGQCANRLDTAHNTLQQLDNLIETSVGAVNQKLVKQIKSQGIFTQRDKEEAFTECKKMVLNMVSPSLFLELESLVGDVDEWLDTRIEYQVHKQKT